MAGAVGSRNAASGILLAEDRCQEARLPVRKLSGISTWLGSRLGSRAPDRREEEQTGTGPICLRLCKLNFLQKGNLRSAGAARAIYSAMKAGDRFRTFAVLHDSRAQQFGDSPIDGSQGAEDPAHHAYTWVETVDGRCRCPTMEPPLTGEPSK